MTSEARMVQLSIRTRTGAAIVFERRGTAAEPLPVQIKRSLAAARVWIEAHHTGVRWDTERTGSAMVGMLAGPIDVRALCRVGLSAPITYSSADYREHLPEAVLGPRGPMIIRRCEQLESGCGWQPIYMVMWEQRRG